MHIHLFHGECDALSLLNAKNKLEEIKEDFSDFELVNLDLEGKPIERLINEMESNLFFSSNKIIFAKRLLKNSDKADGINLLLPILKESAFPIIIFEEQKVPKTTKYYKFFNQNFIVHEQSKMNKSQVINWFKDYVKAQNLTIESQAINELVSRSNFDLQSLITNSKKLKSLPTPISKESIERNFNSSLENTVWELTESLITNPSKTKSTLKNLLKFDQEPILIINLIFRELKNLYVAKKISDPKKLIKILKIPPFAVNKLKKSAQSIETRKLGVLIEKTTNLDYEVKTGNIDSKTGLLMLVKLISG